MFIENMVYELENNKDIDDIVIDYCNNWLPSGFSGLNKIMSIIDILIEYKKYDTIKNLILYSNRRLDPFFSNIYKLLIEKKLYDIAFIIHKHKQYVYGNKEIDYYYVKYMIKNDELSEYADKNIIYL